MAEVTKLLFACQNVLKTGLVTKSQAEQIKALVLAKDVSMLKLAPLLSAKDYEQAFATQAILILEAGPSGGDDASSSCSSSSSASSSSSSSSSSTRSVTFAEPDNSSDSFSSSSSSTAGISPLKLRRMQQKGAADAAPQVATAGLVSPVDNIQATTGSGTNKKLMNLTVAPTPTVQNLPDDDEEQADELMKAKRDRVLKRQSMPERGLPDNVTSQLKH